MKKFLSIMLIVIMVLSIVACTKDKDTKVPENVPIDTEPVETTIDYKMEKEGNPATGYDWYITIDDESVVKVNVTNSLEDLATDKNETTLVGAPIKYYFTFTGLKEGKTNIHLEYIRTFEKTDDEIHEYYEAVVTTVDGKLKTDLTQIEKPVKEESNVEPDQPENQIEPETTEEPDSQKNEVDPVVEEDKVFYLYSITANTGEKIDLKTMLEANLNPKDVYVILHPNKFGEIGFGMLNEKSSEPVQFAYDDHNFVVGTEKLKYTIDDNGHLILIAADEVMNLAPADEYEKLIAELTANSNNNLLVGSWTDDSYVYIFNADGTGEYGTGEDFLKFTYIANATTLYIKFMNSNEVEELEYKFEGLKLIINNIEYTLIG